MNRNIKEKQNKKISNQKEKKNIDKTRKISDDIKLDFKDMFNWAFSYSKDDEEKIFVKGYDGYLYDYDMKEQCVINALIDERFIQFFMINNIHLNNTYFFFFFFLVCN